MIVVHGIFQPSYKGGKKGISINGRKTCYNRHVSVYSYVHTIILIFGSNIQKQNATLRLVLELKVWDDMTVWTLCLWDTLFMLF